MGRRVSTLILIALCLVAIATAWGRDYVITDMRDFSSREVRRQAFRLSSDEDLKVYIVGARNRESDQMFAYGWILDARSREVVWSMNDEASRPLTGERKLRLFDDEISLPRGEYEAYYFAGDPFVQIESISFSKGVEDVGDLAGVLGKLLDQGFGKDARQMTELRMKYEFKLVSLSPDFVLPADEPPKLPNQAISITRPRNLVEDQRAFKILAPVALRMYALGEYSEGGDVFVDGARVINARTRQKVWAMERWNTDWAGGAAKNRMFDDEIKLSPGDYVLYYWTDDSHTFGAWNGAPPHDPYFWGATLAANTARELELVQPSDVEEKKQVLVQITKVGDDVEETRQFVVKEPANVNVYAIGEGRDGQMYDYGWIEDARTGQRVWEMEEEQTDHAGGASKNRLYDGNLSLGRGQYILGYVTDGSHSYDNWNAAAPFDPRHYGITLYGYGEGIDAKVVELPGQATHRSTSEEDEIATPLPPSELHIKTPVPAQSPKVRVLVTPAPPAAEKVLVKMTELGDDVDDSEEFELSRPSHVRVYAVGEGTGGQMYDYGWITNEATGQIVWEMTFRKTANAGGAGKNRMVNEVILLDSGTYQVHFVTDDSHSYDDFNAAEPNDPENWGITVSLEQ